jgi:cyanophycinase
VLPLIDRESANRASVADALRASRLIYLLGGFTHYLGQALLGSASWQAALEAYASGAVIAGSSAGAMVLCQHYYDPQGSQAVAGLGLVPNACVLPHQNTFGRRWAPKLSTLLSDSILIGIDERTGMLDDGAGGAWRVYGQGAVTLYRHGQATAYQSGSEFMLEAAAK